jgi:hypothetical protein
MRTALVPQAARKHTYLHAYEGHTQNTKMQAVERQSRQGKRAWGHKQQAGTHGCAHTRDTRKSQPPRW